MMMKIVTRQQLIEKVEQRLAEAYAKHGSEQWGRHEFYGILKEEVDEAWDNIKNDDSDELLLDEIIDIVCVCFRFCETGGKYRK
jgi:NTP pyrophosphatase (non-canonical NTP hydrolase)